MSNEEIIKLTPCEPDDKIPESWYAYFSNYKREASITICLSSYMIIPENKFFGEKADIYDSVAGGLSIGMTDIVSAYIDSLYPCDAVDVQDDLISLASEMTQLAAKALLKRKLLIEEFNQTSEDIEKTKS